MPRTRGANGLDTVIGKRIRARRVSVDMSQEELAKKLSLSFQQVQKYEKGMNRVAASRLIEVANVLGCDSVSFLKGLSSGQAIEARDLSEDAFKLARRYDNLPDNLRRVVVATLRAVEQIEA